VIFPGAVATDITGNSGVDIPAMDTASQSKIRTTSPEDAAKIILDGIESDDLHIYVGRDSRTMSLMTRVAPRRATHLIYRQMKDLLSG
jgi:short-subunit dehydrogenase